MKTGYHVVYDKDFFDAIDFAERTGFDFVQFDLGIPRFFLDDLSDHKLKEIGEYSTEKGVEIAFHAPGDNVSLFADYPAIRKGTIEQFQLILDKTNLIGARHVTIHTGHYPEFKMVNSKHDEYSQQYSSYYQRILYENIKAILGTKGNVLLCVENCGFNKLKIEVIRELIEESIGLYLTLDIPKLYTKNLVLDDYVADFMFENAKAVREVHIHDYNREFGKHQNVGEGEMKFEAFKSIISQEETYITFEIRPREAALVSRERLSALLSLD